MNIAQASTVQDSLRVLRPELELIVARWHARVFFEHPGIRPMFPADLREYFQRVPPAITNLVRRLDRFSRFEASYVELGRLCGRLGMRVEHLVVLKRALLTEIRDAAGPRWTPEVEQAWSAAADVVLALVARGACRSAAPEASLAA